jgi:tRNA threonylcarbamoyladenosine biosynthesis protein TsaE
LALEGELGGGKTTFLKGFAKGLGIKEKILSPTFILIKKFNIEHQTSNFKHFYHIDCYRIEKPKEILNLGFNEIIRNSKNIIAIEWADKIKKILPKRVIWIDFRFRNKSEREIKIKWKKLDLRFKFDFTQSISCPPFFND